MTKPISEMIAWLEGEKNERENALPHKEYRYGTITEKEKDIAIIDAILAALSGPSEEERKRLHFIMSRTAVDTWDGEKYMSHEQRNAARQSICDLILGLAALSEREPVTEEEIFQFYNNLMTIQGDALHYIKNWLESKGIKVLGHAAKERKEEK
jgi:hypothetical protein